VKTPARPRHVRALSVLSIAAAALPLAAAPGSADPASGPDTDPVAEVAADVPAEVVPVAAAGADGGLQPQVPAGLDAFWTGAPVRLDADDPSIAARRFLVRHPDRYQAQPDDLGSAGTVVTEGTTVTRFNQLYHGIRVLGAQYVVRSRDHGSGTAVTGTSGAFYPGLKVAFRPVSAQRAVEVARHATGRTVLSAQLRADGQVVLPLGPVGPKGGAAGGVLTRQVTVTGVDAVTGSPVRRELFVSADSTTPLLGYDSLSLDTPVSTTGHGFHADTMPLDLQQTTKGGHDAYVFRDTTRGARIETYDAARADAEPYEDGGGAAGLDLASSGTVPVPASVNKTGAIDAQWGAAKVYDYYRTVLGRNSLDGRGGAIRSIVGVTEHGGPFPNAFWNGRVMVYGASGDGFKPFAAALDVVGHEMTHGVVEHTANLLPFGQPGAINEGLADYFGNSIENRTLGIADNSTAGPLLGEDLCLHKSPVKCATRNLGALNTTKNFDTSGADNGGVHQNSTIVSGALWASRRILGETQSAKLVYAVLTQYLTPSSDFSDVRAATLDAAARLGVSKAKIAKIRNEFTRRGISPGWERRDLGVDTTALRTGMTFGTLAAAGNRFVVIDGKPTGDTMPKVYAGRLDQPGRSHLISPSTSMAYDTPSTDGTSAAWSAMPARAGRPQLIQLRRLAGGAVRTVARVPYTWAVWRTAVSGTTVTWWASDGQHDFVFVKRGSRPVIRVTSPRGRAATLATVRGNQVVYVDRPTRDPYGRTWQRLMAYNVSTRHSRVLYAAKAMLSAPVVTRRAVVFQADARKDVGRSAIMRVGRDGTGLRTLVAETSPKAPALGDIAANDTAVTYSTMNGLHLWQLPLSGGRPVRVSCGRGAQLTPAMGRGRRTVWADITTGSLDLVERARPRGTCGGH